VRQLLVDGGPDVRRIAVNWDQKYLRLLKLSITLFNPASKSNVMRGLAKIIYFDICDILKDLSHLLKTVRYGFVKFVRFYPRPPLRGPVMESGFC
jgi:hypothetical protein